MEIIDRCVYHLENILYPIFFRVVAQDKFYGFDPLFFPLLWLFLWKFASILSYNVLFGLYLCHTKVGVYICTLTNSTGMPQGRAEMLGNLINKQTMEHSCTFTVFVGNKYIVIHMHSIVAIPSCCLSPELDMLERHDGGCNSTHGKSPQFGKTALCKLGILDFKKHLNYL